MTETDIQRTILEFLKLIKVPAWRNNTGRRGHVTYGLCTGSSDIIGIYRGKFLAIEVKVPGKHAEPDQKEFLNIVTGAGGIGFVAHSVDEVREKLISYVEASHNGL